MSTSLRKQKHVLESSFTNAVGSDLISYAGWTGLPTAEQKTEHDIPTRPSIFRTYLAEKPARKTDAHTDLEIDPEKTS